MSERKKFLLTATSKRVKIEAIVTVIKDDYSSYINKVDKWWGWTVFPIGMQTTGFGVDSDITLKNIKENVLPEWDKTLRKMCDYDFKYNIEELSEDGLLDK